MTNIKILNPFFRNVFSHTSNSQVCLINGFFNLTKMKEIPLNTNPKSKYFNQYVTLVNDEDYPLVNGYSWVVKHRLNTQYARTGIKVDGKFKIICLHQLLTGFKITDHIDGNGLNNQRSNLREVTSAQNSMNTRPHKNGTSQYKGVSWNKRDKKWLVTITHNGKANFLGLYSNEKEAGIAYNVGAIKYFGEFAKLNII